MNFISRIIKSINAMRERLKIERHEAMYGPHFNEECALKAVSKMENEDGSRGEHWSLEETTSIANQYGINLKGEKYNKYDWYVALNMIRSDYYRAVVTMTSSDHIKYFVELAKAWLNDKDIEEGKMWYYYCYIMCDKLRKEAKTMLMLEDDEDEEHEYRYARGGRGRGRGRGGRMTRYGYDYDEEMEKCKDILDQLEAQVETPTVTNTVDNSKEINDLKNDVADIRKMLMKMVSLETRKELQRRSNHSLLQTESLTRTQYSFLPLQRSLTERFLYLSLRKTKLKELLMRTHQSISLLIQRITQYPILYQRQLLMKKITNS